MLGITTSAGCPILATPLFLWLGWETTNPQAGTQIHITLNRHAQRAPPFHLEQKLQRLQVPSRLSHRFPPSIKPMTAQQNPVRIRKFVERIRQLEKEAIQQLKNVVCLDRASDFRPNRCAT